MEQELEAPHGKWERRRRKRAFWKRRTVWVALLALAVAAVLTLWLIKVYEAPRLPE